jgi:Raf kinase inhibitor-like YbhB/YbcL family protein
MAAQSSAQIVALVLAALSISSPGFQQNGLLPAAYTCDGAGTNPALRFGGVPPGTKSLALIVFDPDVPKYARTDGRFLHWMLWHLPADTAGIEEGRGGGVSEGGRSGYVGACPPSGEHRYIFELFALDVGLGDVRIVSENELRRAMDGHVIAQAELVGRYTTRSSRILTIALIVFAMAAVVIVFRRFRR